MPFPWRHAGVAAAMVALALVGSRVVGAVRDTSDPRTLFKRPSGLDATAEAVRNDKVWALGQKLFFDPRLSASSTSSCATCHQPGRGWSDALPKAIGDAHRPLACRAPTLLNAGAIDRYGWTGRFRDVAAVTLFAVTSPNNMNLPMPQALDRLATDPDYVARFKAAFADGAISEGHVVGALDRFVRSITSGAAPFDHWVAGDRTAISDAAARGFDIFTGKGQCAECHSGWTFSDGSFHDIGVGQGADIGRGTFFKQSLKLQYAFKTPTLRDVAIRPPYMHDGSLATLDEVVDHYDKGGIDRPSRADGIAPLKLSAREKADLVAFLESLTGGTTFVAAPGE